MRNKGMELDINCQNGTSGLKSRYTFRIKLGDECTIFSLAMATGELLHSHVAYTGPVKWLIIA